jgi:hypothetical protein
MRDQRGKQCSGKSDRPQHRQEEGLHTEQDAGKGICMDTGDDPADGTEDNSDKGTEQDLKHGKEVGENEHKSTEMHTIIT